MRFLVDEGTGPHVAKWLIGEGFETFSVFDKPGEWPIRMYWKKLFPGTGY